ncbi:MAG TPA: hypothetical protein VJZ27_00065 [Aggregatilineales bacterium]|nr:hypothetical protein [Aggregatilineales bacterium]
MKKFYWLMFILMIAVLAACGGDESASEATATTAPTDIPITDTPADTATPFQNPTLPPAATIQVGGATARPTRTPAATITPAPSATSNLNPEVTPLDLSSDNEQSAAPDDNQSAPPPDDTGSIIEPGFTIDYSEIETILKQDIPPTDASDTIIAGTQQVSFDENLNAVVVSFDISGSSGQLNITAQINFLFLDEQLFVNVAAANVTGTTEAYNGDAIDEIASDFQTAIIEAVADKIFLEVGEQRAFAITSYEITTTGISIDTVVGQESLD